MYTRKRIYHNYLAQTEKSVPRDHCLASLGFDITRQSLVMPVTLGLIFLSAPHTHNRYL